MASPTEKAIDESISQVKDAQERGDCAEVARILSKCTDSDSSDDTSVPQIPKDTPHVMSHCTDSQTDLAVTQLVSAGKWESVAELVQLVGDRKQTWTVGGTSVDTTLLHLVAGGRWGEVRGMLQRGVDDNQLRWLIQIASQHAGLKHLFFNVLPHCADDQRVSLLTALPLVERRLWRAVRKVLKGGVSYSVKQWVLIETCQHCDEVNRYVLHNLLPHCADDQLDSVLTTLVERRRWRAVGEVLKRGVSDSVKRWAVTEACQHCLVDGRCFDTHTYVVKHILPHCADDQWDSVLTTLAERRLWDAEGEVLKRGVSDSVKSRAVMDACQNCDAYIDNVSANKYILKDILPHCADDQLDAVLPTLVERRLWRAVAGVLKRGVSDSMKQWAIEEACQHYYNPDYDAEEYITDNLLPHCADDQLDSVLTTLVERRLWRAIIEVLKRGVSDSVKRWAVMEACQHCDGDAGCRNVDGYIEEIILPHCADDQLDSVLTILVERRLWWAVGKVLDRGVSDSVKRWAVDEAVKEYEGKTLKSSKLDMYDYQSDSSFSVDDDNDDDDDDNDDDDDFLTDYILPHCVDDQWDSVLTILVERRLWGAVGEVLKRGVSDSVKLWAVMEACQHCEDSAGYNNVGTYLDRDILPHCADDQLDYVLTTLVEQRMWRVIIEVLARGVSDSVKRWAVMEACQHCDDSAGYIDVDEYIKEYILPHCADDQLDSVFITLVERRMWLNAQHVLERAAGDLNKEFAGQKTCEHCRSAGVYLSKYRIHDSDCLVNKPFTPHCSHDSDCLVNKPFTPHCSDGNLDYPTSALTKANTCTAVRNMSGREVSDAQRRENIRAAFRHADEDTLMKSILPYYVYDSLHYALKMLASRSFWSAFLVLLHNSIIDTLYIWAVVKDTESKDEVFWDVVRNPCDGVRDLTPAMWRSVTWSGLQRSLKQLLDWNTPLCEVLCESLLAIGKDIWMSGREKEIYSPENTVTKEASSMVEHLHQLLMECKIYHVSDLLSCTEGMQHDHSKRKSGTYFLLQLYCIKNLVHQYYTRKAWTQMTDAILIVLTTVPVVPDVQSVALRVMLRHNRWDVISHACLSGVCEHDRRQLFQAAVKQRQWSAVKRWADHTLYDDQRLWALGEARQEKRWDVYLKLADHGLSEWERVGVLFRVTMHADLTLVHHMLTTVADVTDMIDLLTNTPGVVSKLGLKNNERRMNDLKVFENNLKKDTHTLKTLKTMAKRGKWWVVLHNIRHKPNLQHARRALKAAVSSEAWHAVMQLVRLETDVTRRDSLFRDMVRLRQWAVCRELLEQGVSHDLSLELFSEFIEHCQWTLVAMVMECTMDDTRRKKIMHRALMTREGSVVWECIIMLQTRLSVDEREDLFQLAFNREVWQAVKPLIEEKDVTGIRHRDTALLEAIEQHQWDVVDHCQRHHADINMKDDDGHTPIHRAARKGDWEAVKELTVRDGDPNLLDKEGLSVLHRAITAKQWDAVKLLIQFHGDIHLPDPHRSTPLRMLIDARQGEVIESSLMWCPDQQKVVNDERETALHAVCLSGWPGALHHLVARKVDPLAVTKRGLTALCYAVMCKDCPQRMVAECIKLGFTARFYRRELLRSPLVLAVMRGLPVVTQMLCEAGVCSSRQLREINVHLVELRKPNTDKGREFRRAFFIAWRGVHTRGYHDPGYSFDTELMKQSFDYLHQVSSTPRSLVSTCRLVISRCLTLSKTRHRDIAELPLSPRMKNYLMFSDLTDPRYPDLSYKS